MRGASRGDPEVGQARRPRAWFAATHSGGAGAPPGDTTIPCQELADGWPSVLPEARNPRSPKGTPLAKPQGRAKRRVRKRGPALSRRRDGAPSGERPSHRTRPPQGGTIMVAPLGAPFPSLYS